MLLGLVVGYPWRLLRRGKKLERLPGYATLMCATWPVVRRAKSRPYLSDRITQTISRRRTTGGFAQRLLRTYAAETSVVTTELAYAVRDLHG